MKAARLPVLLACIAALAPEAPATASDGADSMTARLRTRAEAPPEPALERPELRDTPVAEQLFFMTGGDNAVCIRSIGDVTGDGRDEIIYGLDIFADGHNLFCLDGASSGMGTVVWSLETADGLSGGYFYGDQALEPIRSDPDGNGYPNFLAGTAGGGRTAYNFDGYSGEVIWKLDTYLDPPVGDGGWVYSLAELNDVTGDGIPECVFGAGSEEDAVFMVNGASSGGTQATLVWQYETADGVVSVRKLGDVNGDADDDVIAAIDGTDRVLCLDGGSTSPSGSLIWQYPAGAGLWTYALGVMSDITGDGVNEALTGEWWTADGSGVRCLNGTTGGEIWRSTGVTDHVMALSPLPDITADGHDEVIVASWENAVIVLDGVSGGQLWKTTVGTTNGGDVWTARAIDDLNRDGVQDVIAGSFDTNVYAMDGKNGDVLWFYPTGNRVFSVYPVGDLTGDGIPEVAVGTQDTVNNVVVHVLDGGAALVLFSDGFESGDTSAWSSTGP